MVYRAGRCVPKRSVCRGLIGYWRIQLAVEEIGYCAA